MTSAQQLVKWLARKTKVLVENMPPVPLCPPQIPHDLCSNLGRRGGKPATNHLSYGTVFPHTALITFLCNCKYIKTPWPESARELYRRRDRRLSAKWVPTFMDRGCHVVSLTDPLRPYSRFFRPEPLLFLLSSSSIVLTRLSGPRTSPTTSQKIW
jgi:hypothetical protein